MADAPWTKFYHEDFLQGVALANLSAEEVGVYAVVLMLIAARGGPIEADSRWINGYAGCATVRKCTAVLDRLVVLGKLERRGKLIGNARMIRIVTDRDAKSTQARRAALARWHGDEQQLALGDLPDNQPDNGGDNGGDKREISGSITTGIICGKDRKTATPANADASPPVRACDSEVQKKNSTHPDSKESSSSASGDAESGGSGREDKKPGRLDDKDLQALYDAVAQASGHNPASPGQIDRAMRFVERWRKDGISFDLVVLPTIKAVISESRDPTRTLGRFDARIRHEHARLAATPKGRAYQPPPSPLLEPDDEDPMFRPMRATLLERLGPHAFASLVNTVRFEAVTDLMGPQGKERRPVKIKPVGRGTQATQLLDGDRASIVRGAARALGFTEVW